MFVVIKDVQRFEAITSIGHESGKGLIEREGLKPNEQGLYVLEFKLESDAKAIRVLASQNIIGILKPMTPGKVGGGFVKGGKKAERERARAAKMLREQNGRREMVEIRQGEPVIVPAGDGDEEPKASDDLIPATERPKMADGLDYERKKLGWSNPGIR
jgi:hypothetical protein